MAHHPIIRFLTENKHVPHWVNVILQMLTILFLYSVFLMSLSVFVLHPEWDAKAAQENLPLIGFLAPYSFYVTPSDVSFVWGAVAALFVWGSWLFSTRVKFTNKSVPRRTISFLNTWLSFSLLVILFSMREIIVIGYEKVLSYHYTIDPKYQEMMHIGSLQLIGYLLLLIPVFVMIGFSSYLYGQYQQDKRIQEWFRTYKFERGWMGRFGDESVNKLPDIQLARNAETNAPVIMQGESRQLGTLLIGPPGSGKTSIKIKTAFRTDLGHIQRMITAFPTYVKKYGYGTEEFVKRMADHLIGSIIIEPAKDLCDDAYELAREHNIPEEFIVYLDPSNPKTPGFNLMVGPTAQVVETITSVLESVAETKDEFFKQAARAVLKHYVYLLKFTRGDNCTILDLDDLYQDPRKAMDLLEELEKTIPSQEEIELMDQDGRIHWIIVKKIVRWFRNEGLSISTTRDGMVEKYPAGHEHANKPKVDDLQHEFTRQTRNLLSDITKNPYLARILYAENAVDLDRLFSRGGILLVNTDLGNLQALSPIFGKLVLLCVQNAVFRRKGTEKTRPMVSFYADEFYDYMNEAFLQLTSQGRKFKFAPLVACQSLTQFGVKFGKEFTESMLGTIRNTIVYGGTSLYDTEMLSKYLGTEVVEELQLKESYSPTYMEKPTFSVAESTTLTEKEIASSDDIMFQEFRYSYIRMVDEKSSKRAIRAVGDFVDTSMAEKWRKALKEKDIKEFIQQWSNNGHIEPPEEKENIEIDLRKELEQLDRDQDEIKKAYEDNAEEPAVNIEEGNRFKPFAYKEKEYIKKKEEFINRKEIELHAANQEAAPSLSIEQPLHVKDENTSQDKELVEALDELRASSPQTEATTEVGEAKSQVSFTGMFGSKEKEKLEKVTTIEKPNKGRSFNNTFTKKNEREPKSVETPEHELKEVELDKRASDFFESLKKQ